MILYTVEQVKEPDFPPTAQHPAAVRARVGNCWVDHTGAAPTLAELNAHRTASIDQGDLDLIDKRQRCAVDLMRMYCNAVLAGTHTQKTRAQTKADFKALFDSLP